MNNSAENGPAAKLHITPDTKIAALLDAYPDLEQLLIDYAPAFEKLKNPILRRTIAKVANLRQAAELGKVPLGELINELRKACGQERWEQAGEGEKERPDQPPNWFDPARVVQTLDARPMLERGEHPVDVVMKTVSGLAPEQIFALESAFLPAPLIEMAEKKGFRVWTDNPTPNYFKTYFTR